MAVAMIAALVFYNNGRSSSNRSGDEPPPVPTPTVTGRALPTRAASTARPSPVQQWRIHGFLEDTDLDLFARSDGRLYRIQTDTQAVTATTTPALQSGGSLMMIVDRHEVLVRGWGSPGDGFRVVDGKAPDGLPDALKAPDIILPGPPGRLWVTTYRGDDPATRLTDMKGHPVHAAHGPSSYRTDSFQTDGHRGLILAAAGGFYDVTENGPRRLTRGQLIAVGRSSVLTAECDATLRCSRYLVDRGNGQHRRVGDAPINMNTYGNGTISNNGRYAALWHWSRTGPLELTILNLQTGATVARVDNNNGSNDTASLLWLPDGRLVGILDEHLFVYTPTSGKVARPDLGIDGLQQLSLRAPGE